MKTVTSALQVVEANEVQKTAFRVYYKRRYWDVGTTAYIWETGWTEVPQDEIVNVDAPVHALDTLTQSQFQVSNTVFKFRNDKMQWKEGSHADSKFKADGTSAFGYEPYLMKFKVTAGFRNVGEKDLRVGERKPGIDTGSEELLSVFTGVGVEFWMDSDERVAYVRASGLEELLFNADARRVSTTVTLETLGTGDGFTKTFYTAFSAIGRIREVTVNAVSYRAGIQYDVSNLNSLENSAQISFSAPPAAGYLVKCSYDYWKTNKTVDSLITDLLIEAGITSYSVDSATLGTISNNITQSSKSDFDAGTNASLDTVLNPGAMAIDYHDTANRSLLEDFNAGTLTSHSWTGFGGTGGGGPNWDIAAGAAKSTVVASGSSIDNFEGIQKDFGRDILIGEWSWKIKEDALSVTTQVYVVLLDTDSAQNMIVNHKEASIEYIDSTGKTTSGSLAGIGTSYKTIRLVRTAGGTVRIYVDDALALETDDSNAKPMRKIQLFPQTPVGNVVYFDDIYMPAATLTAQHKSQTIDTGSGLTAWGALNVTQDSTTGILSFKTRTSTDGASWDAWTAVSATNGILSAVKRYIQVEVDWSISSDSLPSELIEPIVYDYTVQFTGTNVFVAMGNFSEMNCYQAIQELAKLTDFEWGFNDDETFFFRSRTASATPDATFASNSNLSEIISFVLGFDRVFSTFRTRFGNFFAESISTADVRTSPLEIFGRRIFEISSAILINKDTDIADAIVDIYQARLQYKKKRFRILTKFWPQIELSDTISMTFNFDNSPGTTVEPMASGFIGKVIYTRHDVMTGTSEFELEEIL